MSDATIDRRQPRRPLWKAALLGAIPPLAVALTIALLIDAMFWELGDLTGAQRLGQVALIVAQVATAFASIQILLVAMMSVAERRHPQPPPAWLLAGVIATTPMIVYMMWPNIPYNPTGVLIVYGFGMAAAAITRHLRHGGRWG